MTANRELSLAEPGQGALVTIVVIDDDTVDVRGITRAIRKHGIQNPIKTAENGLQGLKLLQGDADREPCAGPHLVLLDINMPSMNGIEFLEQLRRDEKLHGTVVFVLTTSDDVRDIADAYRHNVAGYVVKQSTGYDFEKLMQIVESLVTTVQFPNNTTH